MKKIILFELYFINISISNLNLKLTYDLAHFTLAGAKLFGKNILKLNYKNFLD